MTKNELGQMISDILKLEQKAAIASTDNKEFTKVLNSLVDARERLLTIAYPEERIK